MSYCKLGQKPTITYSFKNSTKQTYKTDLSPIDVQIIPVSFNDVLLNQCTCEQYFVGFSYSGYSIINNKVEPFFDSVYVPRSDYLIDSYAVWGQVKGIRVARNGVDYKEQIQVLCRGYSVNICSQNYIWVRFKTNSYGSIFTYLDATFNNIIKDPNPTKKCGNIDSYCEIHIKYNDQVIFQDRGLYPINFDVQCGDCPEGTIRCEQPGYPGYCCLPCDPIAQRINNLAARL